MKYVRFTNNPPRGSAKDTIFRQLRLEPLNTVCCSTTDDTDARDALRDVGDGFE